MDEVDFFILKRLMANCRLSYAELAKSTHLTTAAVHKRVQKLVDTGTIGGFIARPSVSALKGIWVGAWGPSSAKSIDEVCVRLGEHECTYFVGVLSGKFLHMAAILRDISELQNYSTFVAKTGQIENPTIGIINVPYQIVPKPLSSIDFKILKALNRDARKSVADVAEEVGISTKTAKKAIDRMLQYQLATFTIEYAPKSENDFSGAFYVTLQENANRQLVVEHLNEKFGRNVIYIRTYSNLPYFLTMHTWTKTSLETQKIEEQLQEEDFRDVIPRIILVGYYFDCWLDRIVIQK